MTIEDGLYLICDALPGCFNATIGLQADYMCENAFNNLTAANPDFVCNGSCRARLENIVTECGDVSFNYK